jgi:hypothetical protein
MKKLLLGDNLVRFAPSAIPNMQDPGPRGGLRTTIRALDSIKYATAYWFTVSEAFVQGLWRFRDISIGGAKLPHNIPQRFFATSGSSQILYSLLGF